MLLSMSVFYFVCFCFRRLCKFKFRLLQRGEQGTAFALGHMVWEQPYGSPHIQLNPSLMQQSTSIWTEMGLILCLLLKNRLPHSLWFMKTQVSKSCVCYCTWWWERWRLYPSQRTLRLWDPVAQRDLEILSARNTEQECTCLNLMKTGPHNSCCNSKCNIQ